MEDKHGNSHETCTSPFSSLGTLVLCLVHHNRSDASGYTYTTAQGPALPKPRSRQPGWIEWKLQLLQQLVPVQLPVQLGRSAVIITGERDENELPPSSPLPRVKRDLTAWLLDEVSSDATAHRSLARFHVAAASGPCKRKLFLGGNELGRSCFTIFTPRVRFPDAGTMPLGIPFIVAGIGNLANCSNECSSKL